MSQKNGYEITITEKLDQLTVPDMVDSIWSRIEAQLDIDLPPDQGPTGPPLPSPTGSGPWIGAALLIALAAFLFVFLPSDKKREERAKSRQDISTPAALEPESNSASPPTGSSGTSTVSLKGADRSPSVDTSTHIMLPVADPASASDTPGSQPNAGPFLSASPDGDLTPRVTNPPPANNQDTAQKKQRGVKGITDSSYRIVPSGGNSGKKNN